MGSRATGLWWICWWPTIEGWVRLTALFILITQGLGADQLRIGKSGPQLTADLPVGRVGNTGHGSQGQLGRDMHISDIHGRLTFRSFPNLVNLSDYIIFPSAWQPLNLGGR